jgi:ABC-type cobalamin transport system ATPase subunit
MKQGLQLRRITADTRDWAVISTGYVDATPRSTHDLKAGRAQAVRMAAACLLVEAEAFDQFVNTAKFV